MQNLASRQEIEETVIIYQKLLALLTLICKAGFLFFKFRFDKIPAKLKIWIFNVDTTAIV